MTNEELKQEAIKKAYGEYWEDFDRFANKDGWIGLSKYGFDEDLYLEGRFDEMLEKIAIEEFREEERIYYRPKSLAGIENNNQWVRIEEDGSNLPSLGYYWVKNREDGEIYNSIIDPKRSLDMIDWFSHYQPIIQPEPPLY